MNFALALSIAVSFWGAHGVTVPCEPVAVSGADALMPTDPYGLPAPMATYATDCRVLISSQGAWMRKAFPAFYCGNVVHEVGHIIGRAHGHGVMSAILEWRDIPRSCKQWERWTVSVGRHARPPNRSRPRYGSVRPRDP